MEGTMWSLKRGPVNFGVLGVLLSVMIGCGGSKEEPPATETKPPADASLEHMRAETTEIEPPGPSPSTPESAVPERTAEAIPSSARVLAGKELGMVVTGKGALAPSRSLDVLEQQILSFVPQLQEVYERERESDPGLVGSLEISMTIDAMGEVSDLRFPLTRVSNDKLLSAVFDRMRAWTFPPAEDQVQVRYTLLFLPPGIDQASILLWEKQLGNRTMIDRSGEAHRPVAVAAAPAPAPVKRPSRETRPRPRPAETASSRSQPAETPALGWYRVIGPTMLYAEPNPAAEVVTQLRPGTRVRVVAVRDRAWLEVRSVSNRPPGFLRHEDARPERGERAERP
jgi:hypothetical protein